MLVSLLFFATLVLGWRLTNALIGRGAALATAVFAGMYAASLGLLFSLQALLGLRCRSHADKVKPVRRGDLAAGGAIAGCKRRGEVIGGPGAFAHPFQRADHRTHLIVQEGACRGAHFDDLADPADVEPVQRAQRAVGLALRGAEVVKSCRPTSPWAAACMASASSGFGTHQTRFLSIAAAARRLRMR